MHKFISRYTDKKVGSAQYLAEIMCERMAKKENYGDLPYKFWSTTKWKRTFLYQVQLANSLLKLYMVEAIIMALRKRQDIYSLNANFLDPIIKQEQTKLERAAKALENKPPENTKPVDTTEKPRPSFTDKKSTLSKLRDL
jgi:hypothetical protein